MGQTAVGKTDGGEISRVANLLTGIITEAGVGHTSSRRDIARLTGIVTRSSTGV